MAQAPTAHPTEPAAPANPAAPRGLHHVLWILQLVLAVIFGVAGFMKISVPIPELGRTMNWVNTAPVSLVRFIGVCEVFGAIGLVAPGITGIRPLLTAMAGGGLLLVMALAIVFHLSRGEVMLIPTPLLLGAGAAFVMWGRFRRVPLAERPYW